MEAFVKAEWRNEWQKMCLCRERRNKKLLLLGSAELCLFPPPFLLCVCLPLSVSVRLRPGVADLHSAPQSPLTCCSTHLRSIYNDRRWPVLNWSFPNSFQCLMSYEWGLTIDHLSRSVNSNETLTRLYFLMKNKLWFFFSFLSEMHVEVKDYLKCWEKTCK